MSVNRDDIYKVLFSCILGLLIYIGSSILDTQRDIACRLRIVELNQARIMERMDIDPVSGDTADRRVLSKIRPP